MLIFTLEKKTYSHPLIIIIIQIISPVCDPQKKQIFHTTTGNGENILSLTGRDYLSEGIKFYLPYLDE
jgi:hypothetical protein